MDRLMVLLHNSLCEMLDDEELQKRQLIAWNFKRLMSKTGLTIKDLAFEGQCNESYIRQILSCSVSFGSRAAKKWAHVFGVPFTDFYLSPRRSELNELIDKIKEKPEIIDSVNAFVDLLLKK